MSFFVRGDKGIEHRRFASSFSKSLISTRRRSNSVYFSVPGFSELSFVRLFGGRSTGMKGMGSAILDGDEGGDGSDDGQEGDFLGVDVATGAWSGSRSSGLALQKVVSSVFEGKTAFTGSPTSCSSQVDGSSNVASVESGSSRVAS